MNSLDPIGLALGLASLSGINLYLTVLLTSVAVHFNLLDVSHTHPELVAIGHPWVMAVAGVLYLVEFVADKVPWVDSTWDAVHTFIRIPAGAALAAAVMGDQAGAVQLAAALAGGTLAAGTHFAKAGARAAINTSPEPVTNVTTSLGEDAMFAGGLWMLLQEPLWFLVALVVFVVLAVALIVVLSRFLRRVFRPRLRPERPALPAP